MATPHSRVPGYCLWLVSSSANASLSSLVRTLAPLVDGPAFAPHITLCAPKGPARDSADLLTAALEDALASLPRGPMTLTLKSPAPGTFYYQCVLAPVDQAAGDAARLLVLNAKINEASRNERKETYFPHVSLVYGDLDDGRKAEVVEGAEKAGRPWPKEIVFDQAVLVDCEGTAEQWKIVKAFNL